MVVFLYGIIAPNQLIAQEGIVVSANDQEAIKRIKIAYLYNFLKYIEIRQPNKVETKRSLDNKNITGDSTQSLSNINQSSERFYQVCIVGEDPFGVLLDELKSKKVNNLQVKIQRLDNLNDYGLCHVLYVSQSLQANTNQLMKTIGNYKVLTVSDINDFTLQGGMIRFIKEKDKIDIEINLSNARNSEIKISALLLEIASLVE